MEREAVGRRATGQKSTNYTHAVDDMNMELGCKIFGRGQAKNKQPKARRGVCH
jgi:hypothetical protein